MATGWKKILHEESAAADFPTLNQNTTGSAATLTNERAIEISGDITGTANFDGSDDIDITSTLGADVVDGSNIADDSIDSEHYVNRSIDTGHIQHDAITAEKIADNAVETDHIGASQVTNAKIANDAVDINKIAANAVHTTELKDGAVTQAKIADEAVGTDQIEPQSITSGLLNQGVINDSQLIANDVINSQHYANASIDGVHISADVITGQTAETSVADDDVILIYDTSATALRKMTKSNFVSGLSGDTTLSNEQVQDIVGAMVSGNSESGITVTYQDADGTIDFSVSSQTDNNFTTTLKNKLDGIEGSADVTDSTNVTAAGALMDSECTSLSDVKALNQSVVSGASPNFSTANMSDATDKRFMSNAQEVKLDSVESNADVTDSTNVKSALNANLGTLTLGDSDDTVSIPGNLTVSGATTTLNTATLTVEDKNIKLADVSSPTTTTANGAGIQVETSATEAEFPELKWDNSGKLTGWTLSDHKSTANEDFPVSVMKFGTAAPSGQPDAGQGTFFADATNNEIYIYV